MWLWKVDCAFEVLRGPPLKKSVDFVLSMFLRCIWFQDPLHGIYRNILQDTILEILWPIWRDSAVSGLPFCLNPCIYLCDSESFFFPTPLFFFHTPHICLCLVISWAPSFRSGLRDWARELRLSPGCFEGRAAWKRGGVTEAVSGSSFSVLNITNLPQILWAVLLWAWGPGHGWTSEVFMGQDSSLLLPCQETNSP